ncbi:FHA domain-containing protein FHA2 isoform X2 [Brachypodium distachyon]|uniref:FHA domain-containing protein n=1 Tax=Brachypodium distachyon TaxID=15368 RepID=A0A2K2D2J1_BRADI|nr:FHA domain-containing protein FHA2 isoform X2 [Brachypodium distachyon]PNT68483.1 hypothetical protein BRADI_3g41067v3 [Brachypodium distachyon]|eukprot:XP_010235336.2 FHA domain-containing protein FHA2 isoform X2 [Brachypodium distachyon]
MERGDEAPAGGARGGRGRRPGRRRGRCGRTGEIGAVGGSGDVEVVGGRSGTASAVLGLLGGRMLLLVEFGKLLLRSSFSAMPLTVNGSSSISLINVSQISHGVGRNGIVVSDTKALGLAKSTAGAVAMPASGSKGSTDGEVKAGFAKLQGQDFEYYMQKYSIMLGRNSKESTVDLDLSSIGGGMNISRHHARIFYDFQRRCFALEVLGRNGCLVEGILHFPGSLPVKLESMDLIQIGDKKFYFLLPVRSIFASFAAAAARQAPAVLPPQILPRPSHIRNGGGGSGARGKMMKRSKNSPGWLDRYGAQPINVEVIGTQGESENRSDLGLKGGKDMDNKHILEMEEKEVMSSVGTVLSHLCGPGEWMPVRKLHTELMEQFGNVWHHGRVRKYLTAEEWPAVEAQGRPWYGLLGLLKKYPEHFVVNTDCKGQDISEFVSLVSLLS